MQCLHLQAQGVSAVILLGLFDSEDEGDTTFLNAQSISVKSQNTLNFSNTTVESQISY
jgi:hypothetical protein